jgi:3-hydroxybutyryl-CoA dehydrogenase
MSQACVATLGAGRMGRGIALSFACAGRRIVVVDAKERSRSAFEQLRDDALRDIEAQIEVLVDLGIIPLVAVRRILARIEVCSRDEACDRLARVDLLFEGVPEVMAAKSQALAYADRWLPADAIVASTSSTFLSTSLAALVSSPQRFLNAHWLNPAHLIPLVEISPHPLTEPQVTRRLQQTLESIGKVIVLCSASPGYIVPRLQALLMNEAARMIEQGVATAEDIDLATRYGFGIRYAAMGVVEFIDVGGNDILYYASRYLSEALGDQRYASPEIVGRLMAQGQNGLRSGKGFHDWSGKDIGVYRRQSTARLLELLRIAGKLPLVAD